MSEKPKINEETPVVEEKHKGKEETIIKYGFIALGIVLVLCIIAFAVISIMPTNIVSVGDEKIREEEFDYHYFEQTNMLYQQILEYYPDVSLEVFMMSEYQSGMTYHEFAKQLALERISEIHILLDMVENEGYKFDEAELEDNKDNFKKSFQEYADAQNVSLDDAAMELYGSKFKVVMEIYEKTWISSKYQDDMIRDFETEITEDEISEYYEAFKDELDKVTLKQIFITTYDAETYSYFDEEDYKDAKARAEAIMQEIADGGDFDALLIKHTEDPSVEQTQGIYESRKSEVGLEALAEWAFDPERTDGEIAMIETEIGFHITTYMGRTGYEEAVTDIKNNIAYGKALNLITEKKGLPEYEIGYYREFSKY